MKTTITYQDLINRKACYDPQEIGMPTDYSATITEFINDYRDKVYNKDDIIWAVCHNHYMSDRDLRLFAVWCAREALKLIKEPDQRSVTACDVAERFANGNATQDELVAAWDAAGAAAGAAAWDARAAAGAAARAAWDARDAAGAAAWDAWDARAAARAAWAAARAAAWDAARAARDAAWAARSAQIDQLLTYFNK